MKRIRVLLILMMVLVTMGFTAHSHERILYLTLVQYGQQATGDASLIDGDITTPLRLEELNGNESIVFAFNQTKEPRKIKLFVQELNSSLYFGLEYRDSSGVWSQLPGTGNIAGYELVQGWNTWEIAEIVQANAIRFIFYTTPIEKIGWTEIEVWGFPKSEVYSEYSSDQSWIINTGSLDPHIWKVEIAESLGHLKKAYLIYEAYDLEYQEGMRKVNGTTIWLTPLETGEKNDWVTIVEEINPTTLHQGNNQVEFFHGSKKKNGFQIRNLKLGLEFDFGQIDVKKIEGSSNTSPAYGVENLMDGDVETHWETEYITPENADLIFYFDGEYHLEYVDLYQAYGFNYTAQIQYYDNGQWLTYPTIGIFEKRDLQHGWNSFDLDDDKVTTDRLRIHFENPDIKSFIGRLYEVEFWGSKAISDSDNLEVIITHPHEGDYVGNTTLVTGFVQGDVSELLIDDVAVELVNGSFQYEKQLSVERSNGKKATYGKAYHTIRVDAISPLGEQGSAEVTVMMNRPPQVQITSPVDEFVTGQNMIDISGTMNKSSYQATINDLPMNYHGNTFTETVYLKPGVNLFVVKAVANDGLEGEDRVRIIQDAEPPYLEFDRRYDGLIVIEDQIALQGLVTDYGPAELWINDVYVPLTNGRFHHVVPLEEESNYFTFHVEDQYGNSQQFTIEIKRDTTPPNSFKPTADPAGWTNNVSPVIRFVTTDDTSGVEHYELRIDEGKYVVVDSPYQLPALSDGVHRIDVKAVDGMGWERVETTKVYIDTTPPVVPENFEVISGDERVVMNWKANREWDFRKYRIYRVPIFSGGQEYIEIAGTTGSVYEDYDVVNGNEYSYQISSVDHIDNESEQTVPQTAIPGPISQPVDPEEGGTVKYDQVEVKIPAGAISDESGAETNVTVQVNAIEENDIPQAKNLLIGKTYAFNLMDENDQPQQTVTFTEPVTLEFGYEKDMIPEGFSELDLAVYHYDVRYAAWVKMENGVVDPLEQKIRIQSNHFSMFNVQLNTSYSPDASQYADLGLAPFQEYFKNNQEIISPGSGNLVLSSTDFSIPGRNGLDLILTRKYDNLSAVWEYLAAHDGDIKGKKEVYHTFGPGWSLAIPRIETNDNGQYVYFEDGSAAKLEWKMDGGGTDQAGHGMIEYHEGYHFVAEKSQEKVKDVRSDGEKVGEEWADMQIIITLKDGKVYNFDGDGKILSILDQTGNNIIQFNYDGKKLTTMTDTIGRQAIFTYDATNDRIDRITFGETVYQYIYDEDGRLSQVIDPLGNSTEYIYDEEEVRYGSTRTIRTTTFYQGEKVGSSTNKSGSIKTKNVPVIKEVRYPMGGKSRYVYQVTGKDSHSHRDLEGEFYKILEDDEGTGEMFPALCQEEYRIHDQTVNETTFMVVEQKKYLEHNVTSEYSKTTYSYEFKNNIPGDDVVATTVISPNNQMMVMLFEDNLNVEKQQFLNANLESKIVFQYDETTKDIIKEELYRPDQLVVTKEYKYDTWGNLVYETNSDTGYERYLQYYGSEITFDSLEGFPKVAYINPKNYGYTQGDIQNSYLHNLLVDTFVLNQSPVEGHPAIPVQTHYQYDQNGNLIREAYWNNVNQKWVEVSYSYNATFNYGNVTQRVDPLGNVTEFEYGSEYGHAYLTKVTKKAANNIFIKDGKGNDLYQSIVTQAGYDYYTGLKTWDIDAEGNLTEYEYDPLKRLIKIVYADEDDQIAIGGVISKSGEYSGDLTPELYQGRSNNPVKIQYYDDLANKTTVINATENLTVSRTEITQDTIAKITGNTLDDLIYNKSRYHYDGLNRLIQVDVFNLNENEMVEVNSSYFYYDQSSRKIAEVDPKGYVTFTEYDEMNRVTKIIHPDGNKDLNNSVDNPMFTTIDYDSWDNQRTITDAEGNITVELRDWTDQVVQVMKYLDGIPLSTYADYDDLGNQVKVIDGEGRETLFRYDSLGRLVEEIYPTDQFVKPIVKNNWDQVTDFETELYQPRKIYQYDDVGRLTKELTPGTNWLYAGLSDIPGYEYEYDAVGNLVKEVNPAGYATYHYYNKNGWEVKTEDALGNITQKMYYPQGWIKSTSIVNGLVSNDEDVSDETGAYDLITYFEYDILGNVKRMTLPQGVSYLETEETDAKRLFDDPIYEHSAYPFYKLDTNYTQVYEYDRMGRLIEESRSVKDNDTTVQYYSRYRYDQVGNKVEATNSENQKITYQYTPQYWLWKEITYDENDTEYVTTYDYDKLGNKVKVADPANYVTTFEYDDLSRLVRVVKPDDSVERYFYDIVGNMILKRDGRFKETTYEYNDHNQLTKIIDAKAGETDYRYDPNGNLMEKELPNDVTTRYIFNDLGQMVREIQPEGGVIQYSYDGVGNVSEKVDRKNQVITFTYRRDYLPLQVDYMDQEDRLLKSVSYLYDRNGRRVEARNEDGTIIRQYDPLDRVTQESRIINGRSNSVPDHTYTTGYTYDKIGNVKTITYPSSSQPITYHYNRLNQLVGVDGFADGTVENPAFWYDSNGFLKEIKYNNQTRTVITPDAKARIGEIKVSLESEEQVSTPLLDISYAYDANSNVTSSTDQLTGFSNTYQYDDLDRLTQANVEGIFYGERTGIVGVAEQDVYGTLVPVETDDYWVKLDYQANSVGILLAEPASIGKIELKPAAGIRDHRIVENSLSVYYSQDNLTFELLPVELWCFEKDTDGDITIAFELPISAMAFKVHSRFDDRGMYFDHIDRSTFYGNLNQMVRVYQRAEDGQLEYDYDEGGNRTVKRTVVGGTEATAYEYYENSNRLKKVTNNNTGESFYYLYDANGNLSAKGNEWTVHNDGSVVIVKDTITAEYWDYEYTPDNRLKAVYHNGIVKAQFGYDPDGNRIQSWSETEGTINYIFSLANQVILEENLTESKKASFIYALGRQIAKVEGEIGSSEEKLYYHHDNLGSARMMTGEAGQVKWEQNYLPFGEDLVKPGREFADFATRPEYKFTGQRQVEGIGLYYYGARYYDPNVGRFITEDTFSGEMTDPQTQNRYIYVVNNPLKYVDPTGHYKVAKVDRNVLDLIIEDGDSLEAIVQEIYKSQHMMNHVMAINGLESLENLDIGDHLLLPINYIIVEENNLGLVNFPTLEIVGELRKNGKISEAEECMVQEAVLKPSYDMPEVGFVIPVEYIGMGALIVASIFCEPVDWGMTFYAWSRGDFSYFDLVGLLPGVSNQVAKKVGNGLEAGIDMLRWGNRAETTGDVLKGAGKADFYVAPSGVGKGIGEVGANNVAEFEKLRSSLAADEILNADRVGTALSKSDPAHLSGSFLTKEQMVAGKVYNIRGGDGIQRTLLQTKGELNGKSGIFEYILTPEGKVSHQRFISGGIFTGYPNQVVPKGGW